MPFMQNDLFKYEDPRSSLVNYLYFYLDIQYSSIQVKDIILTVTVKHSHTN